MSNARRFRIIWMLVLMCMTIQAHAQHDEHSYLQQLRKSCQQQKKNTEVHSLSFINDSTALFEDGKHLLQLMIIRHQQVEIQKQQNYDYNERRRYMEAYETNGIIPITKNPVRLFHGDVDSIYCSTLNRSVMTAHSIAGDSTPVAPYEMFREFRKAMTPFPWVRFPLWFWKTLSTIEWVTGIYGTADESFREAVARAGKGAEFMDNAASRDGKAILVGHGFYNRYLIKHLKRMGWKMIRDGGNKNLGVTMMVKIEKTHH